MANEASENATARAKAFRHVREERIPRAQTIGGSVIHKVDIVLAAVRLTTHRLPMSSGNTTRE